MTAGKLSRRIHCQRKVAGDDGWGGIGEAEWQTQFTTSAQLTAMRGSETVMAARITGKQPYVVRVRQSANSRKIRHDWRIVDARSSEVMELRSPIHDPDGKRAYFEFVVEAMTPEVGG